MKYLSKFELTISIRWCAICLRKKFFRGRDMYIHVYFLGRRIHCRRYVSETCLHGYHICIPDEQKHPRRPLTAADNNFSIEYVIEFFGVRWTKRAGEINSVGCQIPSRFLETIWRQCLRNLSQFSKISRASIWLKVWHKRRTDECKFGFESGTIARSCIIFLISAIILIANYNF